MTCLICPRCRRRKIIKPVKCSGCGRKIATGTNWRYHHFVHPIEKVVKVNRASFVVRFYVRAGSRTRPSWLQRRIPRSGGSKARLCGYCARKLVSVPKAVRWPKKGARR